VSRHVTCTLRRAAPVRDDFAQILDEREFVKEISASSSAPIGLEMQKIRRSDN